MGPEPSRTVSEIRARLESAQRVPGFGPETPVEDLRVPGRIPSTAPGPETLAEDLGVPGSVPSTMPRPETLAEDLAVPGPSGAPVPVRVFRPQSSAGAAEPLPVILYLHGGGWIAGSPRTHDRFVRELTAGVGAALAFVDYALAPEHPYPHALHQAHAVAQWIAEHGSQHGLDPRRIAVVGDSAGGNLAAALTLAAADAEFAFVQQVLFYPPLSAACDTDSFREFAQGRAQTADYLRWLWDQYVPDPARRTEPTAAPLHAPPSRLSALPPALIITAEADVVRDEAEQYAVRLTEAGVPTIATRYPGTEHGFVVLNTVSHTPAARAATGQAIETLRAALHGTRNTTQNTEKEPS